MSEAYLRVRSFAQPALLVSVVTQSVLLAERDSLSPSLAVLAQVLSPFDLTIEHVPSLSCFCLLRAFEFRTCTGGGGQGRRQAVSQIGRMLLFVT